MDTPRWTNLLAVRQSYESGSIETGPSRGGTPCLTTNSSSFLWRVDPGSASAVFPRFAR
jgi:hypothetical protein